MASQLEIDLETLIAARKAGDLSNQEFEAAVPYVLENAKGRGNSQSSDLNVRPQRPDSPRIETRLTQARKDRPAKRKSSFSGNMTFVGVVVALSLWFVNTYDPSSVKTAQASNTSHAKQTVAAIIPAKQPVQSTQTPYIEQKIPEPIVVAAVDEALERRLCKAGIAAIMGRDPSVMKTQRRSDGSLGLSYVRADDESVWKYRCQIENDQVMWASDTGRWRRHPNDERIYFNIRGDIVTIRQVSGMTGEETTLNTYQLSVL